MCPVNVEFVDANGERHGFIIEPEVIDTRAAAGQVLQHLRDLPEPVLTGMFAASDCAEPANPARCPAVIARLQSFIDEERARCRARHSQSQSAAAGPTWVYLRVPKTGSTELWKYRNVDGALGRCATMNHADAISTPSFPSVAVARDVCDRFSSIFAHLKHILHAGITRDVESPDAFVDTLARIYGHLALVPEAMAEAMREDGATFGSSAADWTMAAPLAAFGNARTVFVHYDEAVVSGILRACGANATDVVDEQSAFNQARRDTKTRKSKALLSTRGCAKLKAELYPLDDRTVNASLRDMAALEIAIREAHSL